MVLKEVAFIPFSSHSLQDLLAKAKEGCSVFLVERVGVIITATTLMQVETDALIHTRRLTVLKYWRQHAKRSISVTDCRFPSSN